MMCYGQKRGADFWIKRAIFIPIAIAAGIFLFGFVVMSLWNWLLPGFLGVGYYLLAGLGNIGIG